MEIVAVVLTVALALVLLVTVRATWRLAVSTLRLRRLRRQLAHHPQLGTGRTGRLR